MSLQEQGPSQVRVAVLTVSDACSRGERADSSGQAVQDWCSAMGHEVAHREVVPDETAAIVPPLLAWSDGQEVDVIVTTGGTGFGPRDVTPEATRAVLDRFAPGVADAIRRRGESRTSYAPLSRGMAGTRGQTFIVNLPGSPGGVRDGLEVLGPLMSHIVGLSRGNDTPHRQS